MILEVVGFFGTDVSKVSPADQERLTALFQQSLTDALATEVPGRGPARARNRTAQVVILDAEAATPGLRSVSMVIPQARLLGTGYYAVSGKYPFVGGGQAAFKATDAMTGQVLGGGWIGVWEADRSRLPPSGRTLRTCSRRGPSCWPTGCMPIHRAQKPQRCAAEESERAARLPTPQAPTQA